MSAIQPTEIIPTLLLICTGFKPTWEEHLGYWKGEEAGIFNDSAQFVHYLVDTYEQGDAETLYSAFETIEKFMVEGTEETKQITIVGILETLQCYASHRSYGEGVFVQYLGPNSTVYWHELENIWEGKSSLADVIRAEYNTNI
ncbi:MAG: hypothetical protein M3441_09975 [Chloroflexota bacterium]|nr:hypothetical protein [Chloroflexota bacterium]